VSNLEGTVVVRDHVLGARFEGRVHEPLLVGARRYRKLPAVLEEEGDEPVPPRFAAELVNACALPPRCARGCR